MKTEEAVVSVTSPRPGDCWLMEGRSRHVVKWEATGVRRVVIFLEIYGSEDDEIMRWLIAKGVAAISGSYSFVLADIHQGYPAILAHHLYKIRIIDVEGAAPDAVSEFFSIVKEFSIT